MELVRGLAVASGIDGMVLGQALDIAAETAGRSLTLVAGLEIERDNYPALAAFRAWADREEAIQQVYYVTGQVDLVAIVMARRRVTAAEPDEFHVRHHAGQAGGLLLQELLDHALEHGRPRDVVVRLAASQNVVGL